MKEIVAQHPSVFQWWQPKIRRLICPVSTHHDYQQTELNKKVLQLEQLGCSIEGRIYIPLNLDIAFLAITLPAFLSLKEFEEDEDENVFCFEDQHKRERLRIYSYGLLANTNVWTRYLPQRDFRKDGKFICVPCVIDTHVIDEDDPEECRVIWHAPERDPKTNELLFTPETEAEKWLDEHYPNWRDPSAYRD